MGLAAVQFILYRGARWVLKGGGVAAAFLACCINLKWQPFSARLLLPLFVAACPLAAFAIRFAQFGLLEALRWYLLLIWP